MRGTRLAGVSPCPRPAQGFAPVQAPRCSAPGFLRVSRATAARTRGLGSPSLAGSEGPGGRPGAKERAPTPRASFHPDACGPRSRAHLSAGEAADWAAPQSVGSRLAACILVWGFFLSLISGVGGGLRERPQPLALEAGCALAYRGRALVDPFRAKGMGGKRLPPPAWG